MTDKKNTSTKATSTRVVDGFNGTLKWLDTNILPLIALPVLAVLAADSIASHIKNVPDNAALAVGIAVAAILAVKTHR